MLRWRRPARRERDHSATPAFDLGFGSKPILGKISGIDPRLDH
jgi:hypothetical protein